MISRQLITWPLMGKRKKMTMTTDHEDPQRNLEEIGRRDHSFTSEYRIFGPPGCGKTTNLARQIRRAADKFGAESILVTSFSRTAAAELAGRDLPIPQDRIGTLHSFCYRALESPLIAEANVEAWNQKHPHLQITSANKNQQLDGEQIAEEESEQHHDGDALLFQLNAARGKMISRDRWPTSLKQFAVQWEEYKRTNRLFDFCDLIETALHELDSAPGNPSVIFVDEAQDLNPMQLQLIRKWGSKTKYFILSADDDQTILSFTGACPEAVLDPEIPEDHKIILRQSYRLPRSIHAASQLLIRQVSRRQEKIYLPSNAEGSCLEIGGTWKSPEYAILKTAVQQIERGRTVMLLASCRYMLRPLIQVLRKHGIPFHNPYRKSEGFWNPIRFSRGSAANRVLALLKAHPDCEERTFWNRNDLQLWIEKMYTRGILKPGIDIKKITHGGGREPVTWEFLAEIFDPSALDSLVKALDGDYRNLLDWWRKCLNASFHPQAQFPINVALVSGPQALKQPPKAIVGTIHSVKGGEADVVFLFPDLSRSAAKAYDGPASTRDSVIRLFYVGLTRARETVYVCQPASNMTIKMPRDMWSQPVP
jgi:superfamily I DNA/RNA helicase